MLISAASQSTPRARWLQARMSGSSSLRPVAATLSRHRQQTRAYRFGMWSSYLDPELHRDLRRRQRIVKYKYAETLNRRLSWDQHPLADDHRSILRRVVGRYWTTPRYASRSVNTAVYGRYGMPAKADKAEAEKSFTSAEPIFANWKNELDTIVNPLAEQPSQDARRAKLTSNSESDAQADIHAYAATVEEEYVFDPITNRKVLKKTYGSVPNNDDGSTESFRSYRSQFTTVPESEDANASQDGPPPVYSNGPPPRDELNKYSDVEIDPVSAGKPGQFSSAAMLSEEYSLNHLPPEETEETYDDLDNYNPSKYDEIETKAEEDSSPKYDDLHQYKPYTHNESATAENASVQDYNDLHKYTPYMHNEGFPAKQEPAQYKDLGEYETYQGAKTEVKSEEKLGPQYEDLDKYNPTRFSDYKNVGNPAPTYKDLDQYQPYQYDEIKEALPELEPSHEELSRYQPTEFEDPVASQTDKSSQQYDDLSKYNPTKFHTPVVEDVDKPFQQYGDLDQYKAFRFQEPEGAAALEHDIVAESLKEFDSKNENSHLTGNYARDFPEEFSASWSSSATGLRSKIEASDSQSAYNQELGAKVQSAEKEHSDNLARTANASSVLETALDRQANAGSRERLMNRRENRVIDADPYSRKPMGLETSYTEECGPGSSEPSYVKMYGRLDRTEEADGTQTIEAIPLEKLIEDNPTTARKTRPTSAEPTVYKILAYDPTMQKITAAETTSVVSDQAAPLTPAEALLRLSNPTKFFPHFAPLQEQGFEIVSGSGDVLVFRKVRDAAAAGTGNRPPSVNPIDMMGKPPPIPNAAAFVSPTGFVNYDLPPVQEQSPPFRSNITVRREEPVFSGPKGDYIAEGSGKRKKTGVTKRMLVGGFWVAGISYALGVIAEYFTTGGVDGKGPTGF